MPAHSKRVIAMQRKLHRMPRVSLAFSDNCRVLSRVECRPPNEIWDQDQDACNAISDEDFRFFPLETLDNTTSFYFFDRDQHGNKVSAMSDLSLHPDEHNMKGKGCESLSWRRRRIACGSHLALTVGGRSRKCRDRRDRSHVDLRDRFESRKVDLQSERRGEGLVLVILS